MKREYWSGLLLLLLVAAAIGFCLRLLPHWGSPKDDLSWVRSRFRLEQQTLEKIEARHRAYMPHCMEMCERIAKANGRVRELIEQGPHNQIEVAIAIREAGAVASESRISMLSYVYEVASAMPPEESKRFLKEMAPHLAESAILDSQDASHPPAR